MSILGFCLLSLLVIVYTFNVDEINKHLSFILEPNKHVCF